MDQSTILNVVISIACMIVGAMLPGLYRSFSRRKALSLASHVFPTSAAEDGSVNIHVRASLDELEFGRNPPTLRGYTHSGDVESTIAILKFFDDLPVDVDFSYFETVSHHMKNVVIIGASSRSDISRDIGRTLDACGVRIHPEERHAYFKGVDGAEYICKHATYGENNIVTRDAGIIFRKTDDLGCTVLLCAGIHTFGSQAATEVALSAEFQKFIKNSKLTQFLQYVTVDVISSGRHAGLKLDQTTICWKEYPLELWPR